ncbi:wiskott-Aldrich syndrome protein family member 1-like [Zingiber officinale]|uniref:wiskott-Aldrich syndrome protein family member 1-like n=1 Tax=Zingiber officinale TaxID=94328 RepID=UPI001C4BC085|nr:wiskott-Aldrich syndrome protein family member 1-like [Zingiber officinale]
MASPTSSAAVAASATAAASLAPPAPDPPSSSSHPLPQPRPYASPTLRPPPHFSPQPPLGKPLNPPPPPPTQGFLYHHRAAFPRRPSVRPSQAAAAVMAFAASPQARPFVYGPADPMVTQMHVPVHHLRPPTAPLSPLMVPRTAVATTGPTKSVRSGAHQKVTPHPSVSSTADDKSFRKRERSREDDTVVINDRKVKLLDGCSSSLYSLCRSWVQNGQPLEIQVLTNFGDAEKLLPRPLPASMVDSEVNSLHENDTEADDAKEDELGGSIEELPMEDLLQRHIKHAKSVRARMRKERLRRIQRCKQRLALLLPPPSELGKNETTP